MSAPVTMQDLRSAIDRLEREQAARRIARDEERRQWWEDSKAEHFAEFCSKRIGLVVSQHDARELLAGGLDPVVENHFSAWRVATKLYTLR